MGSSLTLLLQLLLPCFLDYLSGRKDVISKPQNQISFCQMIAFMVPLPSVSVNSHQEKKLLLWDQPEPKRALSKLLDMLWLKCFVVRIQTKSKLAIPKFIFLIITLKRKCE